MDFRHLVADDELRSELLDRIDELTVMPARGPGSEFLESLEGGPEAFREVAPSTLEAGVRQMTEGAWSAGAGDGDLEAIILRFTRPVFFVSGTGYAPPADGFADSEVLMGRLQDASGQIAATVPSVGRIDLTNHMYDWVGTGWVVAPDVVVTNQHVARLFADSGPDGGFAFRAAEDDRRVKARVDLRREYKCPDESLVRVREVLWIEPDGGPDVALLRVDTEDEKGEALPPLIPLMTQDEVDGSLESWVAVVGYPARSPYTSLADQQRIFDGVYDVKRLAPGTVMAVTPDGRLAHDATTLGGNSGSVVVDLTTGKAVGLHYGGIVGDRNRAVQAPVVQDRLSTHG
jgi:Trypsin-like peptidase domain